MPKKAAAGSDGASLADRPTVKYTGSRTPSGAVVIRTDDQGKSSPLSLRLDLRSHSPTGFEWGYGGSGPAQLALALLADAIGAEKAQSGGCYQKFKFKVIAGFQGESWELTREEVLAWYNEHRRAAKGE